MLEQNTIATSYFSPEHLSQSSAAMVGHCWCMGIIIIVLYCITLITQPPTVLTPQLVPRGTKLQTPLVPHRWEQCQNACPSQVHWNFGIIFNKKVISKYIWIPFQNLQSKSTTTKVRSFVIHLADFHSDFSYLFHFDLFLGTQNKCQLNQRISTSLTSNLTSTCSGYSEFIGSQSKEAVYLLLITFVLFLVCSSWFPLVGEQICINTLFYLLLIGDSSVKGFML